MAVQYRRPQKLKKSLAAISPFSVDSRSNLQIVAGTATRTVGLLGGILTYAVEAGIDRHPTGSRTVIRKPKDNVRQRRLSEAEYRTLGRNAARRRRGGEIRHCRGIIRQIAVTGCRRSEMIRLRLTPRQVACGWKHSKEGDSIRPVGLPVIDIWSDSASTVSARTCSRGRARTTRSGSIPSHWKHAFEDSPLSYVTPHVLRHSFASIANDLGFTEVTIAALVGHAKVW